MYADVMTLLYVLFVSENVFSGGVEALFYSSLEFRLAIIYSTNMIETSSIVRVHDHNLHEPQPKYSKTCSYFSINCVLTPSIIMHIFNI